MTAVNSDIARRRATALAEGGRSYQRKRAALLRAAAKVFRERGYRGATLNDIAAELGTERGSLYYYVSGKEELFHEIVKVASAANVARLDEIRHGPGTPVDKLRAAIVALMSSYDEHYPYLYVYVQEDISQLAGDDTRFAEDMKAIDRQYTQAFTGLVEEGLDDGSLQSPAPAQVTAYGIIGMVNWTHRWYQQNGRLSAPEIGEAYATMVLDGLRTARPRRKRA
jgi:AcrR family transcriptional regulator